MIDHNPHSERSQLECPSPIGGELGCGRYDEFGYRTVCLQCKTDIRTEECDTLCICGAPFNSEEAQSSVCSPDCEPYYEDEVEDSYPLKANA